MSLHLSKCHVCGNHTSQLICDISYFVIHHVCVCVCVCVGGGGGHYLSGLFFFGGGAFLC